MRFHTQNLVVWAPLFWSGTQAVAIHSKESNGNSCRKTEVAVLGAGISGLASAWALSNASISDFIIVEHNSHLGGRMMRHKFGKKADGTPYEIELGANWFHGIGPDNVIWELGQKYGIESTFSNYSSIRTYDEAGAVNYLNLIDEFEKADAVASRRSSRIVSENLQDYSVRNALSLSGWKPGKDMHAQAAEWWKWDFDFAVPPDHSSAQYLLGINGLSEQGGEEKTKIRKRSTSEGVLGSDHFITDQRGYGFIAESVAAEFLRKDDDRLLLNTTVTAIEYSEKNVKVSFRDGDCIEAKQVICSFSVGVLKNDVVEFKPKLPDWKREAIEAHDMATYTKIFLQFNETFWGDESEYLLYADPKERGRYPLFQSLNGAGFLEGSNIIFVTVTADQSYAVEKQTDKETKEQIMDVLRKMFPDIQVPEPVDFFYPRWTEQEWSFGSYSNWPTGLSLERHQNLRANVGRVWFAGEATATFGRCTVPGAYDSGQTIGERVAGVLKGAFAGESEGSMRHYENLHGLTFNDAYNADNGWILNAKGEM